MEMIGLVVLAFALGVLSIVQNVTNGVVSGRIGLWTTMVVNTGVLFAGSLVFWSMNRGWNAMGEGKTPWYLLIGGFWGLAFLAGAAFVVPRLGAGPATALMVAGQLILALVFDHFGVPSERLPMTPMRLVGAILLMVGAVLVLWPKLRA